MPPAAAGIKCGHSAKQCAAESGKEVARAAFCHGGRPRGVESYAFSVGDSINGGFEENYGIKLTGIGRGVGGVGVGVLGKCGERYLSEILKKVRTLQRIGTDSDRDSENVICAYIFCFRNFCLKNGFPKRVRSAYPFCGAGIVFYMNFLKRVRTAYLFSAAAIGRKVFYM